MREPVTLAMASEKLSVPRSTLNDLVRRGRLKPRGKLGKQRQVFELWEVEAAVATTRHADRVSLPH